MLSRLILAWSLMALCVVIHAGGLILALRSITGASVPERHFWPGTLLFIRVAGQIIFLHLCQIVVWALAYFWGGAMPDLASGLYFSVVTYTTTGYGDLVLPREWQLVGGIEALTGILMCGLSTGFFFAVVSRVYTVRGS